MDSGELLQNFCAALGQFNIDFAPVLSTRFPSNRLF
jgi:hypothetical protein